MKIDLDRVDIEDRYELVASVWRLYRENRAEDAQLLIECLPDPGVNTLLGSALTALYAHGKLPEMVSAVSTGGKSCGWDTFARLAEGYDGAVTAKLKIVGGSWWLELPVKSGSWFRRSKVGWVFREIPKVASESLTKLSDFGLTQPKKGPIIGEQGDWGRPGDHVSALRFPPILSPTAWLNTDDILSVQPMILNTTEGRRAVLHGRLSELSDSIYEELTQVNPVGPERAWDEDHYGGLSMRDDQFEMNISDGSDWSADSHGILRVGGDQGTVESDAGLGSGAPSPLRGHGEVESNTSDFRILPEQKGVKGHILVENLR